jgi:hypothetical protein
MTVYQWRELAPVSSQYTVPPSLERHESEFEAQAMLYVHLRNRNVDVRGEVIFRAPKPARWVARFDLVVYSEGRALCIIEVKRSGKTGAIAKTRQGTRYTNFGVPVLVCCGTEDLYRVADRVLELLRAKAAA